MDRRTFLSWCGVGALASSLPWAIAACTPQEGTGTPVASGEFKPVGTVAQLDQTGQLLIKDGVSQPALVIRDPSDTQKLIAVNPTCTHEGCTVAWKGDAGQFVCPCHEAQFAADGAVQKGPATRPLSTYEVKLEGTEVLVKGV